MIALEWNNELMTADAVRVGEGLARDHSLKTCVVISLFTDGRARADDPLPTPTTDRRGWVGDALADEVGDQWGSRLWLLRRAKQTEDTRRRAEEYTREALQWIIAAALATQVDVSSEWIAPGLLALGVAIYLSSGAVERYGFDVPAGTAEAA